MVTLVLLSQAQQVPKGLQDLLGQPLAAPAWLLALATVGMYAFNVALKLRAPRPDHPYPANGTNGNGTGEWRGRIEATIESVSAALIKLSDNQTNVVRIIDRSTETLDRLATQLDRHDRQAAAAVELLKNSLSQQQLDHEEAHKRWQEIVEKLDAVEESLGKGDA